MLSTNNCSMAIRNDRETNARIEDAEKYLGRHRVLELFEDLCTMLCYRRPTDVREFLIEQLQVRKKHGAAGHVVFTEQELDNVFTLFDLKQEKKLTAEQTKEALKTLAHSSFQTSQIEQLSVPEAVDRETFKNLSAQVLR